MERHEEETIGSDVKFDAMFVRVDSEEAQSLIPKDDGRTLFQRSNTEDQKEYQLAEQRLRVMDYPPTDLLAQYLYSRSSSAPPMTVLSPLAEVSSSMELEHSVVDSNVDESSRSALENNSQSSKRSNLQDKSDSDGSFGSSREVSVEVQIQDMKTGQRIEDESQISRKTDEEWSNMAARNEGLEFCDRLERRLFEEFGTRNGVYERSRSYSSHNPGGADKIQALNRHLQTERSRSMSPNLVRRAQSMHVQNVAVPEYDLQPGSNDQSTMMSSIHTVGKAESHSVTVAVPPFNSISSRRNGVFYTLGRERSQNWKPLEVIDEES
uniref:Uncharacterized protein n=1 Tax=Timspurckia oligopyrenoides TaxID=708627 RepID=A0A7S0ZH54_9RHOD